MKLVFSGTSPFVRKVRVLLAETGLTDRVELEDIGMTTPVDPEARVVSANPLAKIPCLYADDGQVLYDSRVICEYLDGLHDGPKMFPAGAARWPALRRQALADGTMDAGVLSRYEATLRPEALRWDDWLQGQLGKVKRAIGAMEDELSGAGDSVDIGTISCACALGYIDFRFGDLGWREQHAGLAGWYDGFAARPSMQATEPT